MEAMAKLGNTSNHLGNAVRARREQLKLRQQDIAGVSTSTLHKVEKGETTRLRAATVIALEEALEWEPGSFNRLVGGGDAKILVAPQSADDDAEMNDRLDRVESLLEEVLRRLPPND